MWNCYKNFCNLVKGACCEIFGKLIFFKLTDRVTFHTNISSMVKKMQICISYLFIFFVSTVWKRVLTGFDQFLPLFEVKTMRFKPGFNRATLTDGNLWLLSLVPSSQKWINFASQNYKVISVSIDYVFRPTVFNGCCSLVLTSIKSQIPVVYAMHDGQSFETSSGLDTYYNCFHRLHWYSPFSHHKARCCQHTLRYPQHSRTRFLHMDLNITKRSLTIWRWRLTTK